MSAIDTPGAIDAAWRMEWPRLIAGLTRIVRDVGLAEDLAQDALVSALEQWPKSGIPDNPGAWLMTAAKRRAIDHFRRNTRVERKHEELGREVAELEMRVPDLNAALDDNVGDDMLRLMFIACHPVLSSSLSPPSRNVLCGRNARSVTSKSLSRFLAGPNWPAGSPRCWRSSISFLMKDTRPLPVMTGCAPVFAKKPCAWAVSSPSWRPTSPKCMASSP